MMKIKHQHKLVLPSLMFKIKQVRFGNRLVTKSCRVQNYCLEEVKTKCKVKPHPYGEIQLWTRCRGNNKLVTVSKVKCKLKLHKVCGELSTKCKDRAKPRPLAFKIKCRHKMQ